MVPPCTNCSCYKMTSQSMSTESSTLIWLSISKIYFLASSQLDGDNTTTYNIFAFLVTFNISEMWISTMSYNLSNSLFIASFRTFQRSKSLFKVLWNIQNNTFCIWIPFLNVWSGFWPRKTNSKCLYCTINAIIKRDYIFL